jgi:hypothetical protein
MPKLPGLYYLIWLSDSGTDDGDWVFDTDTMYGSVHEGFDEVQ